MPKNIFFILLFCGVGIFCNAESVNNSIIENNVGINNIQGYIENEHNSIEYNSKDNMIQIIIAEIGLFGVILGVVLSTIFTKIININYENIKIGKRIYYRIFTELKYCFLTETAFRKGHDTAKIISISELKTEVEDVLKNNTEYLDKDLFSIYHSLISDNYFENFAGDTFKNIEYLKIFSELLNCIYTVFKKYKMVDKILLNELNELVYSYKIWHLLLEKFRNESNVEHILMLKWQFKNTFYDIYRNKKVQKLIKDADIDDEDFLDQFGTLCGSIVDK
jgi:hypothetical protein